MVYTLFALSALVSFFSIPTFAKEIEITLRLKERVPIEQLAKQVIDPSSDRFGKPYSAEEIKSLVAPSDQDYSAFIKTLQAAGYKITFESKSRLLVSVRGDDQSLADLFHTKIHYLDQNKKLHEATVAPQIPRFLSLAASVIGFDNSRHLSPRFSVLDATSPSEAGMVPEVIKKLYGFNPIYQSGFTGRGQHIAVAGYDSYYKNDVAQYFILMRIRPAPIFDQVVFNGKTHYNDLSALETALDMEFAGMIAPGATLHYFGSSQNNDAGEVQLFTAILDDDRAKIVNYSWGECEKHISKQHHENMTKIFARAVAQGVNILAASGDSGARCYTDKKIDADWPGANPYVVAVGGTSALVRHKQLAENAWDGSGGGFSKVYSRPSWQASLPATYTGRAFPDVAFDADPYTGEPVWGRYPGNHLQWLQMGGTSMAAPQWCGFLALVNEARGSKPLGFINPILYGISAVDYPTLFRDILKGNNQGYNAGPGWDPTTGWGSMRADSLFNYLKSL